jgi:hypothetical protein
LRENIQEKRDKASLVSSGEQVRLPKFGFNGNQVKKKTVEKHGKKEKYKKE